MKTLLSRTAAGLIVAALLPLSAQAQQVQPIEVNRLDPEIRREVVKYDDLNLSADAGLRTLKTRISAAARRVCATDGQGIQRKGAGACRQQAAATALDQVANLVFARAGESSPALVVLAAR